MEQYVGEIRLFAGSYPPVGWAFCDGSLLSIAENEVLFMLLGTTYGGNGQTTFALPDLRGRLPVGQGRSPQSGNSYMLGGKDGVETVTLIQNQLPQHTHPVSASSQPGTTGNPQNAFWAAGVSQYAESAPDGTMLQTNISGIGGSQPHANMMPYLAVSFIISLVGVYPSQG